MTSRPVTVREYIETDAGEVTTLWNEVFGYDTPHNDPEKALAAKVAFQPELLFVALLGEQIVGTAMGGYDGHRGWIYSVAVSPSARRKGIGAALVARVEKELAAIGCVKLNLQVRSDNAGVVRFYEGLGYQVEERISMGKVL